MPSVHGLEAEGPHEITGKGPRGQSLGQLKFITIEVHSV